MVIMKLAIILVSLFVVNVGVAAEPPKDADCIIIDEVIDLPDGRTVIRKAWLCERPLKDKNCAKYICKKGQCFYCKPAS